MTLTAEAVENLFTACCALPPSGEKIDGVLSSAQLDVTGKEEQIKKLLSELPEQFQAEKGGGWSFLAACNDKHGHLWTGMHTTMEKLFMLGIAAGYAKFLLPREFWSSLPGGMPYIALKGVS
jgi:hypothetical protein